MKWVTIVMAVCLTLLTVLAPLLATEMDNAPEVEVQYAGADTAHGDSQPSQDNLTDTVRADESAPATNPPRDIELNNSIGQPDQRIESDANPETELLALLSEYSRALHFLMFFVTVGLLFFAYRSYYYAFTKDGKELKNRVYHCFGKWKISKSVRARTPSSAEISAFYAGVRSPDRHALDLETVVQHGLDALRPLHAKVIRSIRSHAECHFLIQGDRLQGKSLFLARLAHELSRQKFWRTFRFRYRILWYRGTGNGYFREDLRDENVRVRDLVGYKERFCRVFPFFRRRLIVFIDDISKADFIEQADAGLSDKLHIFLKRLRDVGISTVVSAEDWSTSTSWREDERLELRTEDKKRLLNKLVEHEIIAREGTQELAVSGEVRKKCGNQLFAFMSTVFGECLDRDPYKTGFMKAIESDFARLNEHKQETLKLIAVCQLAGVYVPRTLLSAIGGQVDGDLVADLGVLVSERNENEQLCGVECLPFLTEWLITRKFKIQDDASAIRAFEELFERAQDIFLDSSETQVTLGLILRGLIDHPREQLLDLDGKEIARQLWKTVRPLVERCIESKKDATVATIWGKIALKVGEEKDATQLYLDAYEYFEWPDREPEEKDIRTAVALSFGLASLSSRSASGKATDVFARMFDNYQLWLPDEETRCRLLHKYCQLLLAVKRPKEAERVIATQASSTEFDALLWEQRGDIMRALDRLREADEHYKKAIAVAIDQDMYTATYFGRIQHYAVFLIEEPVHAMKLGEDPVTYLDEAERVLNDCNLPDLDTVLNAWAKLYEQRRNFPEARRKYEEAIKYCQDKGYVNPRCNNSLANLLLKHHGSVHKSQQQEWLQSAEECCRNLIRRKDVTKRSKRDAHSILGRLLCRRYFTPEGKRRPDYEEAVKYLDYSFDSSPEKRDDDGMKNFQDVRVHNTLARAYLAWSDSENLEIETRRKLQNSAQHHFELSFRGLPRDDLRSSDVLIHVLRSRQDYAFFLWKIRGEMETACNEYAESIRLLEQLNVRWPGRYVLYYHYARFLSDTGVPERFSKYVSITCRALALMPRKSSDQERYLSDDLAKATEVFFQYANHHMKELGPFLSKLDEAIGAFTSGLHAKPTSKTMAAALAALLLLVDGRCGKWLKDVFSERRVTEVLSALVDAWKKAPGNAEAIEGLLRIMDDVAARYMPDYRERLDDLSDALSLWASGSPEARRCLHLLSTNNEGYREKGYFARVVGALQEQQT